MLFINLVHKKTFDAKLNFVLFLLDKRLAAICARRITKAYAIINVDFYLYSTKHMSAINSIQWLFWNPAYLRVDQHRVLRHITLTDASNVCHSIATQ